jgi:hypothetical protein
MECATTGLSADRLGPSHARSGDRVANASYLGLGDRLENAIADFDGETCATQNVATMRHWLTQLQPDVSSCRSVSNARGSNAELSARRSLSPAGSPTRGGATRPARHPE